LDAYGVEADISQPTISAETVENDPKADIGDSQMAFGRGLHSSYRQSDVAFP
jgi:hypothetical protein